MALLVCDLYIKIHQDTSRIGARLIHPNAHARHCQTQGRPGQQGLGGPSIWPARGCCQSIAFWMGPQQISTASTANCCDWRAAEASKFVAWISLLCASSPQDIRYRSHSYEKIWLLDHPNKKVPSRSFAARKSVASWHPHNAKLRASLAFTFALSFKWKP